MDATLLFLAGFRVLVCSFIHLVFLSPIVWHRDIRYCVATSGASVGPVIDWLANNSFSADNMWPDGWKEDWGGRRGRTRRMRGRERERDVRFPPPPPFKKNKQTTNFGCFFVWLFSFSSFGAKHIIVMHSLTCIHPLQLSLSHIPKAK